MTKFQIVIALLCIGLLTGCGGGGSSTPSSKQQPAQPVVLKSIQITPAAPSIAAGLSQQFVATGYYSDNTSANLTSSATWSSSNAAIATVSNTGVALGKASGSSVVSAAVSGVSGSATLSVTAPTLVSLAVSPANPSVALGTTVQFSATGTFTDGSTQNMTAAVQWTSSAPPVADVNVSGTAGLAMGMALGTTSISAAASGVSSSAVLTVTPAVLSSLAISPSTVSIAQGTSLQFSAAGTFTDGSKQDLSASVQWSSANPSIAGINLNGAPGLAKSNAPGMATITASLGSLSASALLTVTNATLTSVAVTPAAGSFPLGTLQQFTATGAFSDGTTQDITGTVGWSSSNNGVASITVSGLLTARNLGTVTITATSGSISGATSASVNAADLASIAILPGNLTMAATTSQQLSAVGTFNDGSTRDLTSQATWTSSNTTVAKVSTSGLTRGLTAGTSMVSVTLGPVSASVTLAVTNAQVVSISVTPASSTIAPATKLTLTATGSFDDGSTQIISRDAVWASDNPAIATVGSSGVITAVASGTANIQATLNGVSASVPVNVSSVTLTSIAVNPPSAVLAPASTLSYTARGTFSDGSTQIITNAVAWSSSAANVASINNGLATGQSAGATTITAQQGSISGSADLIVESSPLISIQIAPANAAIAQQTATQFRAIGTFADGSTQDLTNSVSWTASPLSVATVSEAVGTKGLAAGLTPGVATITALFAGQVGTASLTVTSASLTSITITPNAASIPAGSSQQFIATGNFSDGTTQNLTTQATWTSSTINVATASGSGLVNTATAGTTTISASMNGVSGSTVLAVY